MNEELIAHIEQLDQETKTRVIEYAKSVTLNQNTIGLKLAHIAELIRNKAFAVNMQSQEGIAEFRKYSTEALTHYFAYWTDARIQEEVDFVRRNNRLNRDKILRELYYISRIKS